VRPNILMFDDWDWMSDITDEQNERYRIWASLNKANNLTIIEIGAGKAVPSVRNNSYIMRSRKDVPTYLIRVNPRE